MICLAEKKRSKYTALTLKGEKEKNNEHGREGKGEKKKKGIPHNMRRNKENMVQLFAIKQLPPFPNHSCREKFCRSAPPTPHFPLPVWWPQSNNPVVTIQKYIMDFSPVYGHGASSNMAASNMGLGTLTGSGFNAILCLLNANVRLLWIAFERLFCSFQSTDAQVLKLSVCKI